MSALHWYLDTASEMENVAPEEEFQNDYDRGVDSERSVLLRAVNSKSGSNLYRSTVTGQTDCTLDDDDCSGGGKNITGAGAEGG